MMALMSGLRTDLAMLIERGGWVMLPLMVLSVISLALIVERIWFWAALHRPKRIRWLQRLRSAMRSGDTAATGKLLAKDRSPYSQVGHALHEHGAGDAVAVEAVEPEATGKYVFAPGVREEFGVDAVMGMVDLISFFNAPWPPASD